MKVLYILSGTTKYGGATKAFMNLLNGVIKDGITPIVFCPDNKGIYEDLISMGIKVEFSNFRFSAWPERDSFVDILLWIPRFFHHTFITLIAYYKLLFFTKREKPDIIHSNVSVIDIGYRVAKKLGIKHIWHIREYGDLIIDFYPSYKNFISKVNSSYNFSIVITNGIQLHHKLPDEKSLVIMMES